MLPLLAGFLNYLSQARGEVYLEEHEWFALFLPINELQGDSWVCFLESQDVSQHTPHCASLLGWQQLQGPLQRILGADSPLRSVREKAVCGMRCLRSISQQKEHCREQASSTAEKKANVAAETSCNVHLANICSGRLIKYSITPGDCTKICSDAAGAEALGRSPSLWPP